MKKEEVNLMLHMLASLDALIIQVAEIRAKVDDESTDSVLNQINNEVQKRTKQYKQEYPLIFEK